MNRDWFRNFINNEEVIKEIKQDNRDWLRREQNKIKKSIDYIYENEEYSSKILALAFYHSNRFDYNGVLLSKGGRFKFIISNFIYRNKFWLRNKLEIIFIKLKFFLRLKRFESKEKESD